MFIDIEGVCFRYNNGAKDTIRDFSLQMSKGDVTCILGESGCGKSTLLRIIAGLEQPYKGTININGTIVCDKNKFIEPEKRDVGMVFQDYALFPHMTVAQNIQYGLRNMNRKEKEYKVTQMLELINLKEYINQYPYELSGGQQQRVAIARALAPNPSLLLLDEPFSNLDANIRVKIREQLKDIIHRANITSIFVTHDEADAQALADEIVILKNNRNLSN